jgi:hypothetical protein
MILLIVMTNYLGKFDKWRRKAVAAVRVSEKEKQQDQVYPRKRKCTTMG